MNNRGFTLIELMIVVVIIGILAAIAFPSYTAQMHKSRRGDATIALLALQQAQEKLRGSCNVYGRDLNAGLTDAGANVISFQCVASDSATTALRFDENSTEGWYTISVPSADTIGFVALATADGGDRQEGDTDCKYIRLTVDADDPNGVWSASTDNPPTVPNDTTDKCL